jgi:membrane protease YdiL (CAAX protease family)
MKDLKDIKYFSSWWAILFIFLSFNLIPIPFTFIINSLGNWVYQNPVMVDMSYLGIVSMHPIADNLISIFSMSALVIFILWRMNVRNIPYPDLGLLSFSKKDLYLSVFILVIFIALEEVYMLMLDIEMPQGFIDFMLSEPIILSLISVLIIAPIAEEFIFRGFLFSQLSRTRLGAWGAVSISSFLWTIIHFQYEFKILLILFIFGIFLGYIRMAYNSLGLPIAIHAINNLVAFLIAYYYV